MKTLIISLLSIAFVSFANAKQPVSLRPENKMPSAPDKNTVDLSPYKNVKLKQKEVMQPSCTSKAGVQYKPGTLNYDTCMKETENYTPPGLEEKIQKNNVNPKIPSNF